MNECVKIPVFVFLYIGCDATQSDSEGTELGTLLDELQNKVPEHGSTA